MSKASKSKAKQIRRKEKAAKKEAKQARFASQRDAGKMKRNAATQAVQISYKGKTKPGTLVSKNRMARNVKPGRGKVAKNFNPETNSWTYAEVIHPVMMPPEQNAPSL